MFDEGTDNKGSYLSNALDKKFINKLELARKLVGNMKMADFESRFDWFREMNNLVRKIREWNE